MLSFPCLRSSLLSTTYFHSFAMAAMHGCPGCILYESIIAKGVLFISQIHTYLHKIVQMGIYILGFLAPSLRAAEESLLLHKAAPVHMILHRHKKVYTHTDTLTLKYTHN